MIRILYITLFLIGLQLPLTAQNASAPTDTAPTGKIGFVDIEIVIEQSRAIRMAMDSLDRELADRAREIDAKERAFKVARFDLDKQERLLASEDREKRRNELVKLQEEIDQMKFNFEQELRMRERQIEPVLEKVMGIVADVADEKGFDLILRGEVVIYGRTSVDVTEDVIRKLDSDVASVLALFNASAVPENSPAPEPSTESDSSTHTMTPVERVTPQTDGSKPPAVVERTNP